jgi:hypothetical protein
MESRDQWFIRRLSESERRRSVDQAGRLRFGALFALRPLCAEAGTRATAPFPAPLSPLAASFLRSGQVSLEEANSCCAIEIPAPESPIKPRLARHTVLLIRPRPDRLMRRISLRREYWVADPQGLRPLRTAESVSLRGIRELPANW